MMNFKLTPKAVAQNMNYQDLIKVMVEYKKLNPDYDIDFNELALRAEIEFKEAPIRKIIYSNEMVEYMIILHETNITSNSKRNNKLDDILIKANLINKDNFGELMIATQQEAKDDVVDFYYNFDYIQDEIFYAIYPDKR
ncbi:MAG: hypothetical protein U9N34_08075 [Candidatus Cloacimonadota bacterium]|nr:hypothetical protein [Candidatus Cloacimonadota bacterium]